MRQFRNQELVCTYADKSELVYLPDIGGYVWIRPRLGLRNQWVECPVIASSHREAQEAVLLQSEKEMFGGWGC